MGLICAAYQTKALYSIPLSVKFCQTKYRRMLQLLFLYPHFCFNGNIPVTTFSGPKHTFAESMGWAYTELTLNFTNSTDYIAHHLLALLLDKVVHCTFKNTHVMVNYDNVQYGVLPNLSLSCLSKNFVSYFKARLADSMSLP